MPWYTFVAIYFIVWWLVFFTVLPWGQARNAAEEAAVPGADPGAPDVPRLGQKVAWTTVISAVVCGLFCWAFVTRIVAFEDLTTLWGLIR